MHLLLPPPLISMVELVAVIFVAVVALAIGGGSWLMARALQPSPAAERERLQHYLAWLEDRRRHAETHGYDEDMKNHILAELARAQAQFAALQPEAA